MADEAEKQRLLSLERPDSDRDGIYGFFGEYRWLSNFHISSFFFDGAIVETAEHAYQAQKALAAHDWDLFKNISHAKTAADAKRMGKAVKLPEWALTEESRIWTMKRVVLTKFVCEDEMVGKLRGTKDLYLEETNWWNDKFWGVYRGEGRNELGKILMWVRETLS